MIRHSDLAQRHPNIRASFFQRQRPGFFTKDAGLNGVIGYHSMIPRRWTAMSQSPGNAFRTPPCFLGNHLTYSVVPKSLPPFQVHPQLLADLQPLANEQSELHATARRGTGVESNGRCTAELFSDPGRLIHISSFFCQHLSIQGVRINGSLGSRYDRRDPRKPLGN